MQRIELEVVDVKGEKLFKLEEGGNTLLFNAFSVDSAMKDWTIQAGLRGRRQASFSVQEIPAQGAGDDNDYKFKSLTKWFNHSGGDFIYSGRHKRSFTAGDTLVLVNPNEHLPDFNLAEHVKKAWLMNQVYSITAGLEDVPGSEKLNIQEFYGKLAQNPLPHILSF